MSEPMENTPSPSETPDAERRYPEDARHILSLGQEAYESTRQMQVDGGQHVPRAEQPERLPGDETAAADPPERDEPPPGTGDGSR